MHVCKNILETVFSFCMIFGGPGPAKVSISLKRGCKNDESINSIQVFVIFFEILGDLDARWDRKVVWDEIVVLTPGRSLGPESRFKKFRRKILKRLRSATYLIG